MRYATVFIALLIFAISGSAQKAPKGAANALTLDPGVIAHAGLDEIYKRFAEGYRTLDPTAVGALYTEDATYLPPQGDILKGRANIAKTFVRFFDSVKQRKGRLDIAFRIVQRQVDKDLAYDVGIFTLTSFNEKGGSTSGSGKFVVVAKRGANDKWSFQVDAYSDMPK